MIDAIPKKDSDPHGHVSVLSRVATGNLTLAVQVHDADDIFKILDLKNVVESHYEMVSGNTAEISMVLVGATEAWLVRLIKW